MRVCVVVEGAGLSTFKGPIRGRALLLSPLPLATIRLCIMPMLLGSEAVSSQLMLTLVISARSPTIAPISSNITQSSPAVDCPAVGGKSVSHRGPRGSLGSLFIYLAKLTESQAGIAS